MAIADRELVSFLQWALPRLDYRWRGFRKVRRRLKKRLKRRIAMLRLVDLTAYRRYLEDHPDEWLVLDECCPIAISRFYRDKWFHARLGQVLAELAAEARERGAPTVAIWSAGCASGEEPYTLALLWRLGVGERAHGVPLHILGTDIDPVVIDRAYRGVYPRGTLAELPDGWRDRAFEPVPEGFRLADAYRAEVRFLVQDIRSEAPDGPFDVILCRNLAFTYFSTELQRRVTTMIRDRLRVGGVLGTGSHESLPEGSEGFEPLEAEPSLLRRVRADRPASIDADE